MWLDEFVPPNVVAGIVSSFSTVAFVGGGVWLFRNAISTKIAESIRHGYAKELEDYRQEFKAIEQRRKVDSKLLFHFLEWLPADEDIEFFRKSFDAREINNERRRVDKFFRFVQEWRSPTREFFEQEIQKEFDVLLETGAKLKEAISGQMCPGTLGAEYMDIPKALRSSDPVKYARETSEINGLADDFVKCYDSFVRSARQKVSYVE